MIINHINYCLLFSWNYWYNSNKLKKWSNSHNWYNKAAMLHSMLQCSFNPIGFHYISRDQPKAHELTNHILHPSPEPSRRSPGAPAKQLRRRCRMVLVSPKETTGSFPKILSLGWRKELVSCSRARKGPGNWQIPASLKWIDKYTKNKCHNIFNWYNYHSQDHHMTYVSSVDTSSHSRDLDPVSVIADANNSTKTWAYQTVSGDTTKLALSIPGGLIMTMSK